MNDDALEIVERERAREAVYHDVTESLKGEARFEHFGAAALLTSAFLLGNAAMRTGGVPIEWNAETLTATGPKGVMALINPPARKGWELPELKG